MKKRKQNVARFLCLLMVCTVLSCMAGCEGKGGSEPAQPALETVTYSNLTDADSRALLSVIFHDKFSDDENTLSVGHAGVLLPSEDGTLYFLEKVAFQEPYRLLKFQNRTELSDYLMEKYDTAWGQDTTRPFIMENDALLEGFRQNPLEKPEVKGGN